MPVHILGATGRIIGVEETLKKLKEFCEEGRCEGQMFNADLVFGKSHILSAYDHAKRAFDQKTNSSTSLVNETLLYASGERQISSAIEKMGIGEGKGRFCIVLVGNCDPDKLVELLNLERDDSVLDGDVEKLTTFGITEKEIETVPKEKVFDLVLEIVAMVDLLK